MMFDAEKLGHDVVRFHNILPVSVCEEVVGAAESANDWVASRVVVDNDSSLASKQREQVGILSPSRNCEQVYFFRNPGLRQYESIILSLADKCLKWWDANICAVPPGYDYEPPYVVRYKVGQQFRAHTDIRRIRDGHIRLFTILFYLSESMGGDLWFPDYKITIPNVPGTAAMFPSGDTHIHASNMVVAGTKYSLPIWVYYKDPIAYYNLERRD